METCQWAPHPDARPALGKASGAPRTFERPEARLRNLPFPASFRPSATYEAEATALRWSGHSLVTGLL